MKLIDRALQKIRNPQEVLFIGSKNIEGTNKIILEATMCDGSIIKLCEPVSVNMYPKEPIAYLKSKLGEFYFEHFEDVGILDGNNACINKNNFDGFKFIKDKPYFQFTTIKAKFKNGEEIDLMWQLTSKFNKTGRIGLLELQDKIIKYQNSKQILSN